MGGGCDLDMDQVAEALTAGTDSIRVHTVGFTLTLYRWALASFEERPFLQ